jgi:hypothetical protein
MRWDIRHGLDGVITDDPKKFLDVRRGWHDGMHEGFSLVMWLDVLRINFFALLFGWLFQMKFGFDDRKRLVRSRVGDVEH